MYNFISIMKLKTHYTSNSRVIKGEPAEVSLMLRLLHCSGGGIQSGLHCAAEPINHLL